MFGKEAARIFLKHVLPRAVGEIEAEPGSGTGEPDLLYSAAVRVVVSELLSGGGFEPPTAALAAASSERISLPWIRDLLGPLDPVEVGKLYEYARGFTLDELGPKKRQIVRCSGAKRNQGLFYTPGHIVRHIVSKTLDSLELRHSEDLLDVRIMDPAVGTGLFLTEALAQLTSRALESAASGDQAVSARIGDLKARAHGLFRKSGVSIEPTDRVAVSLHLVENCLYGVDLDPIAVAISRAVLYAGAAEGLPRLRGIVPLIQLGNSLIGQPGKPTRKGSCSADVSPKTCRSPGASPAIPPSEEDFKHAEAYSGASLIDRETVAAWVAEKKVLHWPASYPEIFCRDNGGFDAVVGNPPYEIVSVKESGIEDRKREQAYFRRTYKTCTGKINTYRLMMERALSLLRDGGALGFIVPATLLADSSAARLRRLILDELEVVEAVVVPEKARAFKGVTQACLVIVARKGRPRRLLRVGLWDGKRDISDAPAVEIARQIIDRTDSRIPLLRSADDKALLEALLAHPPLRGDGATRPAGVVHQGEINMTVHKRFLSPHRTSRPLVRGEHVEPFRIAHPSSRPGRWDWIVEDFPDRTDAVRQLPTARREACALRSSCRGEAPWSWERIALARVVNLGTKRRLKGAYVQPGTFLGDMTNYITDMTVSHAYLLGLLNSRLLNWRIKLTSTNNYLSAAELEALPVPRMGQDTGHVPCGTELGEILDIVAADPRSRSLEGAVRVLTSVQALWGLCDHDILVMRLIETLADSLRDRDQIDVIQRTCALSLLDALVVKLFRVESLVGVLRDEA